MATKRIKQLCADSEVTRNMFVRFDLEDGGRVHLPPDQIARMWNEEQARMETTQPTKVTGFQMQTEYRLIPKPPEITEEWLNQMGSSGWSLNGESNGRMIFMRVSAGRADVHHAA